MPAKTINKGFQSKNRGCRNREEAHRMRKIFTAALFVVFLGGIGLAGETDTMEKTKAAYRSVCQSCHGEAGDGKGIAAATLRTKPKSFTAIAKKSDDELFKVIKEGGPALKLSPLMPPYAAQLNDEEIRQMTQYVRVLAQGKK